MNYKINYAFFFVFLLNTLLINSKIDPDFCGNKHKNLVILDTILKKDLHAQVPAFLGISTGRVEQFLRINNPEIFDYYTLFTEKIVLSKQNFFKRGWYALKKMLKKIT